MKRKVKSTIDDLDNWRLSILFQVNLEVIRVVDQAWKLIYEMAM